MSAILAIDDEPEFLEQVKVLLENKGYRVETAPDGPSGLQKALQVSPSLILLDIIMPGMDGLEVLKQLALQSETWQIPVIMLTAKAETEFLFKARELSAVDYLIKPFTVQDLLKVVKRCTR